MLLLGPQRNYGAVVSPLISAPTRTAERVSQLERYMAANVLTPIGCFAAPRSMDAAEAPYLPTEGGHALEAAISGGVSCRTSAHTSI